MSEHRRVRRTSSEQVQLVRELWLLRERARVQAAERNFLADLTRLLDRALPARRRASYSDAHSWVQHPRANSFTDTSTETVLERDTQPEQQDVYESFPPPRDESAPIRELPSSFLQQEAQLAGAQHRVTVCTYATSLCSFAFVYGRVAI